MLDAGHDLTDGRLIGTQLVGDQPLWRHALLLQQTGQQTPGSLGVSGGLDDLVEDVAVLVDGAPQPASLPVDADNEASGAGELHPRALSEPDVILSHHPAPIVRPYP